MDHRGDGPNSVAKMDEMIVQGAICKTISMVVRPRENAEASAKWLEGIAKKSGVEKTESGLLYKIERPATPTRSPSTTATWSW